MRLVIFTLSLLAVSTLSFAHHSFNAIFDSSQVIEIEGRIARVMWVNPHVRLSLQAPGDDEVWNIETHSVGILSRMQIGRGVLGIGDRVKIAGNPSRRSSNDLFALNALLANGEEVVFDPRGEPRWANQSVGSNKYWVAPESDGSKGGEGIFRVWSTVISDKGSFPLLPGINSYPLTQPAKSTLASFDPLTDAPTLNCAPKGMPTIMEQPYPMEFVEQDASILLRLEEYDTIRTIHLDANTSVAEQPSSLLGYSVGYWEKETLVVSTTHVSWPHFDTVGIPLSEAVEITERFTPSEDGTRLNYRLRVTDAATFTEPVDIEKYWLAVPNVSVQPYKCTN